MNCHAVLCRISFKSFIVPPQGSEIIAELWYNLHLTKHCLNDTHQGKFLLVNFTQHPSEVVCPVWTLKRLLIKGLSVLYSTAVKHDSYFSRLLLVVNTRMRNVRKLFALIVCYDFFNRKSFCTAALYDFHHKTSVVFRELVIAN